MFIDKIRVDLLAGKGGDGGVSFAVNKKPDGGNGGDGGDIILKGSSHVYDLSKFRSARKYEAENGEEGSKNQSTGSNGQDLIIEVPIETTLRDLEGNEVAKISEIDQEFIVAKGGRGGLGNFHFRRGQVKTLYKKTNGKAGEKIQGFLELTLVADVVFIGLPNAGKSSMLNALSNSKSKVAAYPFTTLTPHLGVAAGIILLDLPGLIAGTVEGKGLGTRFMKHADKAKLIAHFISMESQDLLADYKLIRKELADISQELSSKPELLVLTKMDLFTEDEINEKLAQLKEVDSEIKVVSAYTDDAKQELLNTFLEKTNS